MAERKELVVTFSYTPGGAELAEVVRELLRTAALPEVSGTEG